MQVLEKILEEIKQYTEDVYECDLDDIVEYQRRNREDKCTYIVQGIEEATEFIRSHMGDEDKDSWISVEDGLPEEPKFMEEDSYIVQTENIITPFSAYWDGKEWTDVYGDTIDVIAWRPLPESYRPKEIRT